MSPNRFQANTRLWVYRFLVLRDGERCARCFEIPAAKNGSAAKNPLEIDHVDGNPHNNEPENLRFLCKSCNIALRNKDRFADSATCVCERERKEGKAGTRVTKETVNFRSPEAPATMQANFLYEVDFRRWLLSYVAEHGSISKQDAIDAGAEVTGCSPTTTARYVAKLASLVGPLQEVKDMLGDVVITWKDSHKPGETIKVDLDTLMREVRTDVL